MKRTIFIIFIFLLLLSSCKKNPEVFDLKYNNVSIVEEGLKINIIVNINEEEQKNINYIGMIFGENDDNLSEENTLNNVEINFNALISKYEFIITDIKEEYFNIDFIIKTYVIFKDNNIKYFDTNYIGNLYNLSNNIDLYFPKYIRAYVANKVLKIINLSVNFQEYTIDSLNEDYLADIITDYNYVTITITINEDYFLINDFTFIINDNIIEQNKLDINKTTITYRIEDPNWSDYY